jgi:hypothetical protein
LALFAPNLLRLTQNWAHIAMPATSATTALTAHFHSACDNFGHNFF